MMFQGAELPVGHEVHAALPPEVVTLKVPGKQGRQAGKLASSVYVPGKSWGRSGKWLKGDVIEMGCMVKGVLLDGRGRSQSEGVNWVLLPLHFTDTQCIPPGSHGMHGFLGNEEGEQTPFPSCLK